MNLDYYAVSVLNCAADDSSLTSSSLELNDATLLFNVFLRGRHCFSNILEIDAYEYFRTYQIRFSFPSSFLNQSLEANLKKFVVQLIFPQTLERSENFAKA